jgi:phytanoyl-CoA dioxygenase PhyH
VGDEFAGIDTFLFRSTELSLLSVSDRLTGLAERFLGETDLRIYSAEAWAKYTGAADYDQSLHRDYLLHTLVVPTDDPRFRQLELFVYLVDVPEELGATRLLSRTRTPHLPARMRASPPPTNLRPNHHD